MAYTGKLPEHYTELFKRLAGVKANKILHVRDITAALGLASTGAVGNTINHFIALDLLAYEQRGKRREYYLTEKGERLLNG